MLGFASLLMDASSEAIHSVLPLFLVTTLGASLITVGEIEGLAESVASILKIFSGALSDYIGKRKVIVVTGYGLAALSKPLFAIATTPAMVLFARLSDRVGKGIRGAPRDALIADSTEPAVRGAAFGLRQSLDTVGAFIGPLIAFTILSVWHDDFRKVFWCAVLPAVLCVMLLLFGVKEPEKKQAPAGKNPLKWEVLKSLGRPYWLLMTVALFFSLGNSSDAFLLIRAKQNGIPENTIPLALVVMNVVYSSTAYPIGKLSDSIGRRGLLTGGLLLYALVYAGFAFATTPWQIWILFATYGLHLGLTQGILLALVSDQVGPDHRGTAFGFANLVTGIALLPASMLAGILWQHVGPYATFLAGSAFAVVSAIALQCVPSAQRRSQ